MIWPTSGRCCGESFSVNLEPGSDRIHGDHSMGVRFGGRFAGGHVQAARTAYNSTLVASSSNLWQYVRTSELLIEAIQAVVAGYARADHAAAGTSNELLTALTGALLQRADAAKEYDTSETRREDRRMHS